MSLMPGLSMQVTIGRKLSLEENIVNVKVVTICVPTTIIRVLYYILFPTTIFKNFDQRNFTLIS